MLYIHNKRLMLGTFKSMNRSIVWRSTPMRSMVLTHQYNICRKHVICTAYIYTFGMSYTCYIEISKNNVYAFSHVGMLIDHFAKFFLGLVPFMLRFMWVCWFHVTLYSIFTFKRFIKSTMVFLCCDIRKNSKPNFFTAH